MGIEIKGINTLIKKLDKLSKIEMEEAVQNAAEILTEEFKSSCPKDTGKAREVIGVCAVRKSTVKGKFYFADIGLGGNADFNDYKGAYFQNYGYFNARAKKQVTNHVGWFNDAYSAAQPRIAKQIKEAIKKEVKEIGI